jgi:hypothetical protein
MWKSPELASSLIRKRTPLAVWTSVGLEVMVAMWTQTIVSAWSDGGHLHATRYNEAAVSIAGGIDHAEPLAGTVVYMSPEQS